MSRQHTAKTGKKPTLSTERQAIVDQLPDHKWNVSQAAIAVGYAKSYAEHWHKALSMQQVTVTTVVVQKTCRAARTER